MLHRELFTQYQELYRPYTNMLNEQLAKYQLFSSQWRILRALKAGGPKSVVDLANEFYIEKPSASNLVRKLLELGYVESIAGADKRQKIIQLTELGDEVHGKINADMRSILADAVVGVTEEEQETVIEALRKIRNNITK